MSPYWDPFWRSLVVSAFSVVLAAPPALILGYVFARRSARRFVVLETVCMLPLVLPPVVSGFVLLWLLAPVGPFGKILWEAAGVRIPFTMTAAVLASALVSFPLFLRGAKIGFTGVGRALEEAAATLGHRPIAVFLKVSLPLARPGIVAGVLLAFARALGEFGATLVVAGNIPGRTQTLPLAIYQATQLGDARTGWTLVALSVALAFLLMLVSTRFERL